MFRRSLPSRLQGSLLTLALAVGATLALPPAPAAAQDEGEGAAGLRSEAPRLGLLYWVTLEDELIRSDVDGSNLEILRSGLDGPDGLSLDPARNLVYWTNMSQGPTGSIQRAHLDGTPVAGDDEYLVPRGHVITGKEIELDVPGGKVYWADRDAPRIQRSNLDGSGLEVILSGFRNEAGEIVRVENVVGMAVDPENRTFYSTDRYMGIVFRAGLELPEGETAMTRSDVDVVFQGTRDHDRPIDIDIDLEEDRIYWTDRGSDAVRRANLDGSGMEVLVEDGDVPMKDAIGMSLDLAAEKMYWSDMTTGAIHRASLDGTDIETVVPANGHRPLGVEHLVVGPEEGPTAGGQRVGVLGSNFAPGRTQVSFGGRAATDVEVVSDHLLLATVPAGSGGRVDLTVTTPAGEATVENAYLYRR